jgi:hypothetical protein
MAGLRNAFGAAAAACAAILLLAGAALAGNPNNPGSGGPPGQQGTPPGQAKKGTNEKGNGNTTQHGKALGKAKKAQKAPKASKPSHPAHPSHPVTPSHPAGSAATTVIVSQKPAFAATKGRGHEKTAHHKVIICHRTGSATNPYVAINVSINAWQNGHTKHPALDGRSDILLQDPASPGEKPDPALVAQVCGGGGQQAQSAQQPAAAQLATAAPAKSPLKIVAAAGVKGAAASKPKGAAGVLGAISTPVRSGELPFTGLPLWIVALAAGCLFVLGLALRRRTETS